MTFKEGDRVRMQSACARLSYGETLETLNPSRLLKGTVEQWADGALVVRWDDWPLITTLPNPNVESEDAPSSPPEAA
jgi:hypothetical protein